MSANDGNNWSRADAETEAERRGCVCVVPTDYELTVDLDCDDVVHPSGPTPRSAR